MADSIFDAIAQTMEELTALSRLEARGTMRIACREAGIDAKAATGAELAVVLRRLMPRELESRGIEDAQGICEALATQADQFDGDASAGDRPEDLFKRLGG